VVIGLHWQPYCIALWEDRHNIQLMYCSFAAGIILSHLCHEINSNYVANLLFDYDVVLHWVKSGEKNAAWYRMYSAEGDLYKVDDYYLSGKLFRSGYRSSMASENCIYRERHWVFYDSTASKIREGVYVHGRRSGTWKHYHKNGALKMEERYRSDTLTGNSIEYDSVTHVITSATQYTNGLKTGHWNYTGSKQPPTVLATTTKNHKLALIHTNGAIPDTANIGFSMLRSPEPGYNIENYLRDNLVYPRLAKQEHIQGRVVVKFTVDEDGAITNVRILRSLSGGCDQEALRVVSEMPAMQPALNGGEAVRADFTLPIVFTLQRD
jgi:TonB family protein